MRADCSADELALLRGTAFTPFLRAYVSDADGTWRNLADLDGISHLSDVTVDIDLDNKVAAFDVEFRRDAGTTRSLSPLRTDSVLNRNAAAEFAPLIAAGRDIYVQVGVGAPGSTAPYAWHTIAVGVIDRVSFARSLGRIECRDQFALLADAYNIRQYTNDYTPAAGGSPVPLAQEIENALTVARLGDETPTLRVIGDPSYLINHFTGEVEPVLDIVVRLAQLCGWDIRYLWNNAAGEFQLTLYDPQREKAVPDVVMAPDQYIDVEELDDDSTNIRNEVLISYGPATHLSRGVPLAVQDMASVSRYRRRTLYFIEATNSPIDFEAEAQAMIGYALADLKDPDVAMQVELFPFWPIELHDLVRFTANGVHFNTDVDLAVTKIQHRFGGDRPRTILGLRGTPAAYYRGWVARARVPILPRSDEEAGVDDFLSDTKITHVDGSVRVTWTRASSRVAYVFAYAVTASAGSPFPAPSDSPEILSYGTDEILFPVPQVGQQVFVQLEPRDDEFQVLGGVRRLVINPVGQVVAWTYESDEPSAGTGRVTIRLTDGGGFVHPTQKVRFRKTLVGVRSDNAATTAPPGTTTTGTYTFDLALDPKHSTLVEAYWTDANGQEYPINSWTFDRDKNANLTLSAVVEGNLAKVTANFDTDTATGAGKARYQLESEDAGGWTTFDVDITRKGTLEIAIASAPVALYVQGQNLAGAWGPSEKIVLPAYGAALSVDLRLTSTHGIITWGGVNVEVSVDDSAWGPPPPDDDGVVEGNQITVARNPSGGAHKHYAFRSVVNGQVLQYPPAIVPPQEATPTTNPLIWGVELIEHEHAPGVWDLQVGFAQRGAIAYTKVTWWFSWPDSETPTTLAAGVNEFDLYPTYTVDPAGSEQATVNVYVTGYGTDDLPLVESRVASRVVRVTP